MTKLELYKNKPYNKPNPKRIPDLAQVGWIGQTGIIYALDDQPHDHREPGSYQPLLIQRGEWVYNPDLEDYELHEG